MILGAAFCPHPPLLYPALAGGAIIETADLLAGCDAAVKAATGTAARVLVLGGGARTQEFALSTVGSLAGFGGIDARAAASELPLSLTIGRWLLERARPGLAGVRLMSIADGPPLERPVSADTGDTALLIMGDGSARRTLKAPGYLDERAGDFDARVREAVADGRPEGLAGLDPVLGAELLAAGVPAWRAAGGLLAGRSWQSEIYYDDDPFGVWYLAASWTPAEFSI